MLSLVLALLLQVPTANVNPPLYCFGYATFDSTNTPTFQWTDCSVSWYAVVQSILERIKPVVQTSATPAPAATSLSASAGGDQTTLLANYINLAPVISNADSALTVVWSKVSGPGSVSFGNPSVANTNASFSQVGTYVLQITATDGTQQSTSNVTITVQ